MMFLQRLYNNHVLANLTFVLVLVVGFMTYLTLPREKDPTINFNWIVITTLLPGASASDVELRVTTPLEDALRNVRDIKFVSSNSRESISTILIRFEGIRPRDFDKRVADLRREIDSKQDELPAAIEDPVILEITSSNAYPTATLAVVGRADDDNLRYQANRLYKDLERLNGVDRVDTMGLDEPELQVHFHMDRLQALGLTPVDVANTVSSYFQDVAAGSLPVQGENWLIRLVGTDADPGYLASLPVVGATGQVPLRAVADVRTGREKSVADASFNGEPAVILSVFKESEANVIDLLARVKSFIEEQNRTRDQTGIEVALVFDQTTSTKEAINIMQTNSYLGLLFVLFVTWLFLGNRVSLLVTIGIPFILAGTFWVLGMMGMTLNRNVLIGVVISLGMLVDDAVVVVEAIYYRLQRGQDTVNAVLDGLKEVIAPVTTAVMTTMAAFLPLMLLPGILGDFMRVIPIVVTVALMISLIEAYWILPAHVTGARISFNQEKRRKSWRWRFTHRIQIQYTRILLRVMRYPRLMMGSLLALFVFAAGIAFGTDLIKKDFFAGDTERVFYINVEMPPATTLNESLALVRQLETRVRNHLQPGELRNMIGYAGVMFTETEQFNGDYYGQIMVGLHPKQPGLRTVEAIVESMRAEITTIAGPINVAFLMMKDGPPTSLPISVKVRGDDYSAITRAADKLKQLAAGIEGVKDISDDAGRGRMELVLKLDADAVYRAGLNPADVTRSLRLLVDGEEVASMQHLGDELKVRVRGNPVAYENARAILNYTLPTRTGEQVPLRELVSVVSAEGIGNIRHYNFRRAITVEADIDKSLTDVQKANDELMQAWRSIEAEFPGVTLDLEGQLDDLNESLDAIKILFIFGVGLMYLILGTQFRSYFQPFMILVTVPMAFIGVVIGLLINQNPLSLYTLYGVVALAGIAVNASIVLISAAHTRLKQGMSLLHATVYAARRRVIPVLITSLTTIAGLFSLATGLGGKSLVWGPVASAIVWGLAVSTVLTLLVIPTLYRLSMSKAAKQLQQH